MNGLRIINAMLGEPVWRKRATAGVCRDIELEAKQGEIKQLYVNASDQALEYWMDQMYRRMYGPSEED